MTTKRDNTTPIGDLFGGEVLPPIRGEVSDRVYKRRYIPKTYTEAETREAQRVIAHWNEAFNNVTGGFRANAGDAGNVKTYVKLIRSVARMGSADVSSAAGDFSYIDEAVIKQAISLYRADPANMRLGRWKRFSDWLKAESIDFYKSKIKIAGHARLQVAQVKAKESDRVAKLQQAVKHPLVQAAVWASQRKMPTLAYLQLSPPPALATKNEGLQAERQALIDVAARREQLSPAIRESLSNRARKVFAEYFNRPIGSRPDDVATLDGIELALIALYPDSRKLQEPAS